MFAALILLLLVSDGFTSEVPASNASSVPPPVFDNDSSNFTNSGSIKLTWHSSGSEEHATKALFELQRATQADFSDANKYYRGPDRATYISGLADGNYYFRLRDVTKTKAVSGWSTPVKVVVEHHSLSLAFTLFGIGGFVFALTVLVVLRGAAHTADPDDNVRTAPRESGR